MSTPVPPATSAAKVAICFSLRSSWAMGNSPGALQMTDPAPTPLTYSVSARSRRTVRKPCCLACSSKRLTASCPMCIVEPMSTKIDSRPSDSM
eukprot:5725220-Pyramimonas_sp.AAC.1